MNILSKVTDAAKQMRRSLVFVALLYVVSYLIGWYMISIESPAATEMQQGIVQSVLTEQPFTLIIQSLSEGKLVSAILITFAVNLMTGAFLTTTLPGLIPIVGAPLIVAITMTRGYAIGVTYPGVLATSPQGFVLGLGTLILELGAYVFSAAAGINISLAPIFPARYGASSRWTAFKIAWKNAAKIFVIVGILLASGAVWEMTILFLIIPR